MTLQRLVHALGAESPATYPLVLPVLRLCTDPSQPDELNLLEDGLQVGAAPGSACPQATFPGVIARLLLSAGLQALVIAAGRPSALHGMQQPEVACVSLLSLTNWQCRQWGMECCMPGAAP